jgi:hypothetical protein
MGEPASHIVKWLWFEIKPLGAKKRLNSLNMSGTTNKPESAEWAGHNRNQYRVAKSEATAYLSLQPDAETGTRRSRARFLR